MLVGLLIWLCSPNALHCLQKWASQICNPCSTNKVSKKFAEKMNIETCPLHIWKLVKKRFIIGWSSLFKFFGSMDLCNLRITSITKSSNTRFGYFCHKFLFTNFKNWKYLVVSSNITIVSTSGFPFKKDLHKKCPTQVGWKINELVCFTCLGIILVGTKNIWLLLSISFLQMVSQTCYNRVFWRN